MNNTKKIHTKKLGIFFLILFFSSLSAEGQWEKLLKKDRENALKEFDYDRSPKITSMSLLDLIARKMCSFNQTVSELDCDSTHCLNDVKLIGSGGRCIDMGTRIFMTLFRSSQSNQADRLLNALSY